jgi:hypothetical protein
MLSAFEAAPPDFLGNPPQNPLDSYFALLDSSLPLPDPGLSAGSSLPSLTCLHPESEYIEINLSFIRFDVDWTMLSASLLSAFPASVTYLATDPEDNSDDMLRDQPSISTLAGLGIKVLCALSCPMSRFAYYDPQ